ncbi:hypothetical protein HMPREF3038_00625 [Akkermansia sp. KLE1797]|jgi:hypothetical protein|nr:hypothetical protein HMPREF3038_00625 [Akkermansia sp. KLE1797]KXU54292.1 hypothetical protein HMPREF3039_01621 [Akkermansia sp. KLE1798]KZA04646.1 hypothetical protein HMPREF1326_01701 [Akkermansia sp. KLE1605]
MVRRLKMEKTRVFPAMKILWLKGRQTFHSFPLHSFQPFQKATAFPPEEERKGRSAGCGSGLHRMMNGRKVFNGSG